MRHFHKNSCVTRVRAKERHLIGFQICSPTRWSSYISMRIPIHGSRGSSKRWPRSRWPAWGV